MSTSSVISVAEQRTATWAGKLLDYLELTKPRISVMVLFSVALAGVIASWGQPDVARLVHTLVATAFVAASASALNQWVERKSDARMPRTMGRPLPSGRLTSAEAVVFGIVTFVVGSIYMWIACGAPAVTWAVITWASYVCIYTPLKRFTALNTLVGAIPGAMPILIGWTGVGGSVDLRALSLFMLVFLWQFPHFMAIAWLYRRQYADAGMAMMTVVEPTGRTAGVQAVLSALSLILVSLVPVLLVMSTSIVYLLTSFALGVGQLICAIRFLANRNETTARALLRASLIYLPLQLALVTLLTLTLI